MSQLMDVLLSGVFAPNPKKYAWVSEVEAGPYHLETDASAANGGNTFVALCGVRGDFNCHFTAAQIIARLKCQECRQLSTANILDVADQATGSAPVIDSLQVGSSGEVVCIPASPLQSSRSECPHVEALNTEDEVSTGSRKRSECAVHSSVGRPTDFLSLPVPLGREGVSGIAEGREVDTRAGSYTRDRVSPSSAKPPVAQVSGCMTSGYQGPPPDSQILPGLTASVETGVQSTASDCAPEYQGTTIENLLATVERVSLKQRIDFEMRLNRELPNMGDPIHDSNGRW